MRFTKFLPVCLLTLLLSCHVRADGQPPLQWVRGFSPVSGSTPVVNGEAMRQDALGNVVVCGQFQGTVDLDPGAGVATHTAVGNQDVFIAKYNSAGALVWSRSIGGTFGDIPNDVAVDASGNVYCVGYFASTCDFNPGVGLANLTASGVSDAFVLKLDASGNFVWARSVGGTGQDLASGVTVDGSGNVYYAGAIQGTVDVDPGAGVLSFVSAGSLDVLVSKLDATGSLLWARKMGGTGADMAAGMCTDGGTNVYVAGNYSGSGDFDPGAGTVTLTAAGSQDVFITKLDASGTLAWARSVGGTFYDECTEVAADGSGAYACGSFMGTSDFDPGAGTANLTSAGGDDAFVMKLSFTGNYSWARQFGNTGSEVANGVALDGSGNACLVGNFGGTVDFDPGAGVANQTSAGSLDAFVVKLTPAGAYVWSQPVGGTLMEFGNDIAVDLSGGVQTTGSFRGTVDFDPGAGVANRSSEISDDLFVLRLTSAGAFSFAADATGVLAGDIYPQDFCEDPSGNVWVTGHFEGTVDFDPGPSQALASSNSLANAFVAQFSAAGILNWVRTLGCTDVIYGNAIAADAVGNAYTTGYFRGTADMDPGPGVSSHTSSGAFTDNAFVLKLDAGGNFVSAGQIGSSSSSRPTGIEVDASGNPVLTGNFSGLADFDPTAATFSLNCPSGSDVFVAKWTPALGFSWAVRMGGVTNEIAGGVDVDASGAVYICGAYSGTGDFDPGAGVANLVSAGSYDAFVVKLSAAGALQWARSLGGPSDDLATKVVSTAAGAVNVCGRYSLTADVDPGAGSTLITAAGATDIFVVRLTAAGALQWAASMGGLGLEDAQGMDVDAYDNTYVSGYFEGIADMDPGAGTLNLSAGVQADAYALKLSASGSLVWAMAFGGSEFETGKDILAAYPYLLGEYNSANVDFDPLASVSSLSTPANGSSLFLAKYNDPLLPIERVMLQGQVLQDGKALLQWQVEASTPLSSITVEQQAASGYVPVATLAGDAVSFLDPSGLPGLRTYRVAAVGEDGQLVHSNVVQLNVSGGGDWTLAPNPVQRGSQCRLAGTTATQVRVITLSGKEMGILPLGADGAFNPDLPAGLYLLQLEGSATTQRLLILD